MENILIFLKQHSRDMDDLEKEKFYFWNLGKLLTELNFYPLRRISIFLIFYYGNKVLISTRNLNNILLFYQTFSEKDPLIEYPNISWYQYIVLIHTKMTQAERFLLLEGCQNEKWTTLQLKREIMKIKNRQTKEDML